CHAQLAQFTLLERGEGPGKVENPRMLVKVGQALAVRRAMDRNLQSQPPAQMQQPLGMVGVVMGQQDAAEAVRFEALAKIGEAGVDQPTLLATFHQRTTGT